MESDLLMSTFAEAHLRDMTMAQMAQFDLFLDENDWDIYYWATQQPSPTSQETAEGAAKGPEGATANAQGHDKTPKLETDEWRQGKPRSGEWAQTVGTFKPAYRPVPVRWRNSEILSMLRRHVISRSAGGVLEEGFVDEGSRQSGGGKFLYCAIDFPSLTRHLKVWLSCLRSLRPTVKKLFKSCIVLVIWCKQVHMNKTF